MEAALGAFERCVDTDDLARRLRVSRSTRVTPLMFENELIDRARSKPRHLVLPEGTDERILRAAEILLRRGVAELTLLGRPDDIARRTRELGIDLGDAQRGRPGAPAGGATTSPPSTPGCAPTGASPPSWRTTSWRSPTTSAR